jgi:DNA-3-methyladenine glycosylase
MPFQPDPQKRFSREFYTRPDVTALAQDLVGATLVTRFNDTVTAGRIIETEAYCHTGDRACHAHANTRTERTEIMYHTGGHAYVYLCYGIHHLFNIVTNQAEYPDAILVRAIEPLWGEDTIEERRGMNRIKPTISAGPGRLTQALGITTDHYGIDMCNPEAAIWIQPRPEDLSVPIATGPRIGIDYAGEDAQLPWRFGWKGHDYLSKPFA